MKYDSQDKNYDNPPIEKMNSLKLENIDLI